MNRACTLVVRAAVFHAAAVTGQVAVPSDQAVRLQLRGDMGPGAFVVGRVVQVTDSTLTIVHEEGSMAGFEQVIRADDVLTIETLGRTSVRDRTHLGVLTHSQPVARRVLTDASSSGRARTSSR